MKREIAELTRLDIKLGIGDLRQEGGGVWARFYWSANRGLYGHQGILEYSAGKGFETYTTQGCGYCKQSALLEHFYQKVFDKYEGLGGDLEYYASATKCHKGGNCYYMTLNQFKKIKELRG